MKKIQWSTTPDGDCVFIVTPRVELRCHRFRSMWSFSVKIRNYSYCDHNFEFGSLGECKERAVKLALRVLHDTQESTAALIDLVNTISCHPAYDHIYKVDFGGSKYETWCGVIFQLCCGTQVEEDSRPECLKCRKSWEHAGKPSTVLERT